MTMHMLPAYYTTTNMKKRKAKKKTKSQIEADRQHEKFLKKHGLGTLFGKKVERSVAQPGSASGLGPGGRKFESHHPLHNSPKELVIVCLTQFFYVHQYTLMLYTPLIPG